MGSYCELYIDQYPVYSSKSYVDPIIMTMFRESDRNVDVKSLSSVSSVEYRRDDGNEKLEKVFEYRATVQEIIDRLDLMGFTFKRAKKEFNRLKAFKIELKESFSEHDLWGNEIDLLKASTFENYLEAFQAIITSGIHPVYYEEENNKKISNLELFIVDHDYEGDWWGFPTSDIRLLFRVILELRPKDAWVSQHITSLVDAGYYDENDKVCELALSELTHDYPVNSKIIIMTEGTTDTEILKGAMQLLFPHLTGYYSFMDFGVRPPGGVGPLVNAIKSMSATGIENRIIALFDNDTAAYAATASLKKLTLPDTIRISHYPEIELAKKYPTLGPSGVEHLDINTLACSIELYVGVDILLEDGEYIPVQWKGYDASLKKYQGEILNKNQIKNQILKKIEDCSNGSREVISCEWKEMKILFNSIFNEFK